jgi:hypothetical protein
VAPLSSTESKGFDMLITSNANLLHSRKGHSKSCSAAAFFGELFPDRSL